MRPRDMMVMTVALLVQVLFSAGAARAQTSGNEIVLEFITGGDDLRGGNDNMHALVLLRSGTPHCDSHDHAMVRMCAGHSVLRVSPLLGAPRARY